MDKIEDYLSDLPLWSDTESRKVFEEICKEHKVTFDVITQLVKLHRERLHQERAHGINDRIREILDQLED